MDVEITNFDGLSHIGNITIGNTIIKTPALLFTYKKDILQSNNQEILLTNEKNNIEKPAFIIKDPNETDYSRPGNSIYIHNPKVYPKDLPIEFHQNTFSQYTLPDESTYVLPGNPFSIKKILPKKKSSLFIIENALQLYNNPRELVEYLILLHKLIDTNQLLYFPAVADPSNISLLIYLGIDLFDTTQALIAARTGIYFLHDGRISIHNLTTLPCHCPICEKYKENPSNLPYEDLFQHNYFMLLDELHKIHHAIQHENLRNHVSKRVCSSPHLISILRLIEKKGYPLLESKSPVYKNNRLNATSLDALHRPEILRFQQRVLNRYKKPSNSSVLLLLPCSAKKPYSFSKSHKKFKQIIQSLPQQHSIHEVIITSPLGIVPRELELIYPASDYDIPVTGDWFEDEITLIKHLLISYLKKNSYEKILIHLPPPLNKILLQEMPNAHSTNINESATTYESLLQLKNLLEKEIKDIPAASGKTRFRENMLSLASYQFSEPLAEALLDNTMIKGKYPYLKIFDDQQNQLGMLTEKRGLISLTIHGGKRLQNFEKYVVNIANDFMLKGSVFTPGILDADEHIRRGDEVLIFQDSVLKAVGVALMNGEDMVQLHHGKAVNIRHIAD